MSKTILIVDDDIDLLDLLRCSFTTAGFSIVTATNGLDALKLARSRSPDLILLDLVLPELDGFHVCETLRRERATAATPIIMLTGLTSQLNRFAGLGCGANDYVMKPIAPEQIVARVRALTQDSPPLKSGADQRTTAAGGRTRQIKHSLAARSSPSDSGPLTPVPKRA